MFIKCSLNGIALGLEHVIHRRDLPGFVHTASRAQIGVDFMTLFERVRPASLRAACLLWKLKVADFGPRISVVVRGYGRATRDSYLGNPAVIRFDADTLTSLSYRDSQDARLAKLSVRRALLQIALRYTHSHPKQDSASRRGFNNNIIIIAVAMAVPEDKTTARFRFTIGIKSIRAKPTLTISVWVPLSSTRRS